LELKTSVQASSISNLTDARYFAAWGVEWIGFSLEVGNAAYLAPKDAQEIKDWVVGPKFIGEFGFGQDKDTILEVIELLKLDAIELSMFCADELAASLEGITIFKSWKVNEATPLEEVLELAKNSTNIAYHIFDFSGSNLTIDTLTNADQWSTFELFIQENPSYIRIGGTVSALTDFAEHSAIEGLSLIGGEEESVGVKAFDELDEIFELLEAWD
jgi:phosphoribosylanthranilate isomerase